MSEKKYAGARAVKTMRSVALILIMAMMMSYVFFYYEEDINYAVSGLNAPPLTKLVYSQTKTGYKAVLNWKARKGRVYHVLRKTSASGRYAVIARVTATSSKGAYTDTKIGKNKAYTYSVRRIIVSGSKITGRGKYDAEGLTTIKMPSTKVKFTNMKAKVSWGKVSGASKYLVYRKVGKSDKFYKIKAVASSKKAYTDWYYYSTYEDKGKTYSKKLAAIISSRLRGHFLDASNNPLSYKVRGYYAKRVNLVKKESYGLFLTDGEFRLEAPSIVSLSDDGLITWGAVANAEWYRIYKSADGKSWTKVADQKTTARDYIPSSGAKNSDIYQSFQINDFDRDAYYSVRAFAKKNGTEVKSAYDKDFTIRNKNYGEKVLCVGDSISFGSPYYNKEWKKFTYQSRIEQLTGVTFFNPSIPGATYHHGTKDSAAAEEDTDTSTSKLVTGVMQMMVKDAYNGSGKHHNTDKMASTKAGVNKSYLYDYDVVMLAGGTNDYLHYDKNSFKLGSSEIDWEKIKDSEKTKNLTFTVNSGTNYSEKFSGESYDYNIKTFDGAYNQMLKWIEEASIYRIQHDQKPIQVVAMDLFYSDRTNYTVNGKRHYPLTNRNVTKNSIGKTLQDYQKQLNSLNSKWAKVAAFDLYQFHTQDVGVLDQSTCPYATADNLHLTKYSYARFGNSLSGFMMKNFLGKEQGIDPNSEAFIARASKYGMLSERLEYLEEEAAENSGLQNDPPEAVLGLQSTEDEESFDGSIRDEEELDPAVEEMKAYIRLLYQYGYLDLMLDECTPEDRERYERFIEYYDLLGLRQEEPEDADSDEAAAEEPDPDEADGDVIEEENDGFDPEEGDNRDAADEDITGDDDSSDEDHDQAADAADQPAVSADNKNDELDQ